ncbi:putative aldouronate transport system permease protein [Paenibacillus sp. 1_12]|uniref:ABC transporter permease n=1 Tax=Paenibacillus sp. 1_12 TaxID=1566278 RepID=UPI0008E27E64|nr:ABC transporter permease subunit [Paenibacillus sp. 1_12]SFM47342.1 putative aldouronate transport system permease protein [Paenibacillus sp. 1_12]
MSTSFTERTQKQKFGELMALIWKNRVIYTLLFPGIVWYIIFAYGPMGGLTLAFKSYQASGGIWGSPWVGMQNFKYIFLDQAFIQSVYRTLEINLGRMVFQFPMAIVVALLLNEVIFLKMKRSLQTILTFPHFLSWVVLSSVLITVLSYDGFINGILKAFGFESFNFLGNEPIFVPMLYITEVWKNSGWGAIIYLAAIAGIDAEQYEAAAIDGVNRFQRIFHITLPSIMPTIIVMFILSMGNLMSTGFDQIFNLSNEAVRDVAETLDMYIYKITFQSAPDFSYSTAVSLFRSVVNMTFLLLADRLARLMGKEGLLG